MHQFRIFQQHHLGFSDHKEILVQNKLLAGRTSIKSIISKRLLLQTMKICQIMKIGFMAIAATAIIANAAVNTAVVKILCNGGQYTAGDPFTTSLAFVYSDLRDKTPVTNGYNYYDISPYPNAFAYGHGKCNPTRNITVSDCSNCIEAAIAHVNDSCAMRIGGRSLLVDCMIRYEQYPFVD